MKERLARIIVKKRICRNKEEAMMYPVKLIIFSY